mgnify:CR=1 FL=1
MPTAYIMNSSAKAAQRLIQGLVTMVGMVGGAAVLAVRTRYQRLPPWSTLVEPNARAASSGLVQHREVAVQPVAEAVVHVVKIGLLVR